MASILVLKQTKQVLLLHRKYAFGRNYFREFGSVKPKSHQSRTQHGPSRITPEHPGPRDALIRGEPGWKCFDSPSTDDGRSKIIVYTDSTRQHYGSTRSQHGWPRTTTAALRTIPDRPRTMPDPTRCQHGWSRTIPDALRTLPDRSKPNTDRPGPSRIRSISVSIELQFCFISYSSCYIIRTR